MSLARGLVGSEEALARALGTAAERFLSQPDTDTVDRFWSDESVRRTMTGRTMSASQRGALREIAVGAPDAASFKRHVKRMKSRATRHALWRRRVGYRAHGLQSRTEEMEFADALARLADELVSDAFEERRALIEGVVADAYASAGAAVKPLGYDVERVRSRCLGASLGYLVRLAQAQGGGR